jgi:hypothetical protein
MIEPLPKPLVSYLVQFGVAAVYATHDGEVGIASPAELNRTPAAEVWWSKDRRTAQAVVSAIGQRRPADLDQAIGDLGRGQAPRGGAYRRVLHRIRLDTRHGIRR